MAIGEKPQSNFVDWLCDQYEEPSEDSLDVKRIELVNRVEKWFGTFPSDQSLGAMKEAITAVEKIREKKENKEIVINAFDVAADRYPNAEGGNDALYKKREGLLDDLLEEFELQHLQQPERSVAECISSAFDIALKKRTRSVGSPDSEFRDAMVQYCKMFEHQKTVDDSEVTDKNAREPGGGVLRRSIVIWN
ncbi:MAG: hypothetical protein V4568_11735 [Pseudomonadota bacterium]